MVQILFFLSMLCITAMLLKLFWYLDDSHEEEMRINIMYYRKRFLHTQRSTPIYNANCGPVIRKTPAARRIINFYDVGTMTDTDNVSTTGNRSECA